MFLTPTDEEEIEKNLKDKLKKRSSSNDNVPYYLLTKISDIIAEPYQSLSIQLLLLTVYFPAILKNALLIPIHKENDLNYYYLLISCMFILICVACYVNYYISIGIFIFVLFHI